MRSPYCERHKALMDRVRKAADKDGRTAALREILANEDIAVAFIDHCKELWEARDPNSAHGRTPLRDIDWAFWLSAAAPWHAGSECSVWDCVGERLRFVL